MSKIIVKSPYINKKDYSTQSTIFIIDKDEWERIIEQTIKYPISYCLYTDGKWIKKYNLKKMLDKCKIIEDNPSADILKFTEKIQYLDFINFIKEEIRDEIEGCRIRSDKYIKYLSKKKNILESDSDE